ncbi:chitin disaccharide deacetylase [Photobacterium sanguinicancri]|uniref:chitin disaccharide deacetylase n=1 Tax=Photobacterium sanguinicancri TaxID=875932 RepID=UPI003D0CA35C
MMKLIFNADDFGLTKGVNLGTLDACLHGVVRSTTLMVGMPAEQHALNLLAQSPPLKVGLHLRFTTGKPLTSGKTLVDPRGDCWSKEYIARYMDFDAMEIADEIEAQICAFQALGIPLSHLDSHHHAHFHPQILPVVKEIASSHQLVVRGITDSEQVKGCHYAFCNQFYDTAVSIDSLLSVIDQQQGLCDVLEIMCHPAYVDQPLLECSGYTMPRAKELAVLTDPYLLEQLANRDITLCDYAVFS